MRCSMRAMAAVMMLVVSALIVPGCETPESYAVERQKVESLASSAEADAAQKERDALASDQRIAALQKEISALRSAVEKAAKEPSAKLLALEEKIDAIADEQVRAQVKAATDTMKRDAENDMDSARALTDASIAEVQRAIDEATRGAEALRADAKAAREKAAEWRSRMEQADAEVSGAARRAADGQAVIGTVGGIIPGAAGVTGVLAVVYGVARKMLSLSTAVSILKGTNQTAQKTVRSVDSAIANLLILKPELEPAIDQLKSLLLANQDPEVKAFVDQAQGKAPISARVGGASA